MCVSDEPGKSDSAAHYQVVVACGVRLQIELEGGGELDVGPQCHELHFVRGDAAAHAPDQPGDLDHWYLWRWVESSSCEAVATLAARAPRPGRVAMGPGANPPAVLRVPNPAHGAVGVWMRLPGREPAALFMFDIAGRRVLARDLGVPSREEFQVELNEAARLPAGIYWLRLIQGGRVAARQAVVLR
jgi:hypothetical protein